MSLKFIRHLIPTSFGAILNAFCAVYFLQRGGNWIFLGAAHAVMVIVLAWIAAAKAQKQKEAAEQAAVSGKTE